ncbi:hypothetical protein GW17_00040598 [Ensete ventricosum]|nr:hypothetical protein GW17_00040598 [Ensete ventricosum]
MSKNLKEEGRCVVNRGEDMTTIDFGDNVSLAEKLVWHGAGAAEWMVAQIAGPQRATTDIGEESTPTTKSWNGAVDSVVEASIVSKRLSFDSKKNNEQPKFKPDKDRKTRGIAADNAKGKFSAEEVAAVAAGAPSLQEID